VDLDGILAQRRHADVWERHRRGEATSLELLDAYLDAYVPHSTAARIADVREQENRYRASGDSHALAIIAAWRLREQLRDHDPGSPDDAAGPGYPRSDGERR
jgi:undecaprenyl pyrophosphate synthase